MVGYLVPSIANLFFFHLTRGIQDITSTYNQSLILCNTDRNSSRTGSFVKTPIGSRVGGVIHSLSGGRGNRVSCRFISPTRNSGGDSQWFGKAEIDRVLSDRVQGAMQAAAEEAFLVPENLSVVVFDDTLASLTRPRLASVALPNV